MTATRIRLNTYGLVIHLALGNAIWRNYPSRALWNLRNFNAVNVTYSATPFLCASVGKKNNVLGLGLTSTAEMSNLEDSAGLLLSVLRGLFSRGQQPERRQPSLQRHLQPRHWPPQSCKPTSMTSKSIPYIRNSFHIAEKSYCMKAYSVWDQAKMFHIAGNSIYPNSL